MRTVIADSGLMEDPVRPSVSVVDLFAGAGGLALGWTMSSVSADIDFVAAVDCDTYLAEYYAHNFPNTHYQHFEFGDATRSNDASNLMAKLDFVAGSCDVLLAGPPCQTFSAAGKRTLQNESHLVFHVVDFAELAQPKLIIIENVPQFVHANNGRLVGRLRCELSSIGYETTVTKHDALSFGVPQRRKRCFIVASHRDLHWPAPGEVVESLGLNHARQDCNTSDATLEELSCLRDSHALTVANAISDLPPVTAGEGSEVLRLERSPRSYLQRALREAGGQTFNHVASKHSKEMICALSKLAPGETPSRVEGHPLRRGGYFRLAYARLHPDRPASTITTQTQNAGSGRFTHYRDNRTLTVREAARIQSFPDRIRFVGPKSVQRRHVGNAAPPFMSRAFADLYLPMLKDS